jgi:hypothetical protein
MHLQGAPDHRERQNATSAAKQPIAATSPIHRSQSIFQTEVSTVNFGFKALIVCDVIRRFYKA